MMSFTVEGESEMADCVLVPISADAFARSLAAGYLGGVRTGGVLTEARPDQSAGLLAFKQPIPTWAFLPSQEGPIVTLAVDRSGLDLEQVSSGCLLIPGLVRASRIQSAISKSQDELDGFKATYFQFPDIPAALVDLRIADIATAQASEPENLQATLAGFINSDIDADTIDASCGWATMLVWQLLEGGLDNEVVGSLETGNDVGGPSGDWRQIAQRALASYAPESSDIDKAIWGTIVDTAMDHRSKRGFDRRSLLQEARTRLPPVMSENPDVAKWFSFTAEVLEARRDPPPLDDHGSIGRRAALVILLAHDLESIDSFEAGRRVAALAKLFIGAFQGLSRLGAKFKNDRPRLAAAQEIGERMESGQPCGLQFTGRAFNDDLESSETVLLDGAPLFERKSEPSPHRIMLRARALEAGRRIAPEQATGRLRIYSENKDGVKIYVEDDPVSLKANPVVRFWTPIRKMTTRTPSAADLRALLDASWQSGCAIGTSIINDQSMLCAFITVLTNTLDREEFDFHVASLERFAEEACAL